MSYMSEPEDNDLVSRSLGGDQTAYGLLIDKYKYLIFTLACRMMKNREDAEEIAQDTFVKAYQELHTFKGEAKFSSWLYKIAYRKCLDQIKKNKRLPSALTTGEEGMRNLKESGGVVESMETEERNKILKAAIARLKEEDAALVTLYYFEEMSIREIEEITDLSANTIKVRLFRSRKQLEVLLGSATQKHMTT